jgi:hypothetical protein
MHISEQNYKGVDLLTGNIMPTVVLCSMAV